MSCQSAPAAFTVLAADFFFAAVLRFAVARFFFGAASVALFPAADSAVFAGALRPQRAFFSGAAARIARQSSSVSDFGSRSFGILPFFFPSLMYGP